MNMSDVEPHFYPEPIHRVVEQAANIGNQARWLSNQGDYAGAERLQLRALNLKLSVVDEHDAVIAITRNALGELYLKMGRLADAEEQLKKAVSVRLGAGPAFDAAVSIENLGRVYEAKGDFAEARGVRLSHPENIMVCGNYNCPGETFDQSKLRPCSACKSVFYCGTTCQAKDWRASHKRFCKKHNQ